MNLAVTGKWGEATEVSDVDRDGGEGDPLIVARFYDQDAQRLFIAAPDLLAACNLLHKALQRGPQSITTDEIAQIQSAIEQAEGTRANASSPV